MSHSTRDLEKVRRVRNAIEAAGGEPILFFLKCLADHDEIDKLIKREIEARNFFLLCDSSNAKSSKWVQDEIAHVNSLLEKRIETINLEADWQSQLGSIKAILQYATVFLSYVHSDEEAIAPIRTALIANDFSVWDPSHASLAGDNLTKQIRSTMEDAADFGFFIHFLSQNSLESKSAAYEIDAALSLGGKYIPIFLEPQSAIAELMPESVRGRPGIDYSERNVVTLMPRLLHALGVRNTEQPNSARRNERG